MRSRPQNASRLAAVRRAVLAAALGLAPVSAVRAQAVPVGEASPATLTIAGLAFSPAAGTWTARPGAAELTCRAAACAGAMLTVATLDEPCGDDLLRRRAASDHLALRGAPADLAGRGLVFRSAIVASPCRSLSGDTLVACTTVAGRTRFVELRAARDARCRLPTSSTRAAEALLAGARAAAP